MNNYDKVAGLITISRKANKLSFGFDSVKESIIKKQTKTVFYTKDISPKTLKEVEFLTNNNNCVALPIQLTAENIEVLIGKQCKILSITDEGLNNKLVEVIANDKKG